MKIYTTFMGITGAAIASVFLGACSGGGIAIGGSTNAGIDGSAVGRSAVVSRGTITGFGSVIVNGVHYDTSKATIKFDDNPGVESDFRIGQVVTIQGTIPDDNPTRGTADQIVSKNAVEGPISAIDTAAGTVTVLGQVVHVGADTSFGAGLTLANLAVNDIIEVSGFARADGSIDATRIERSSSTTTGEFEVKGIVQNLDTVAKTFAIGALSINYSTAAIDPELGNLQNGLSVEVKGTQASGSVLQATRIELEDDLADLATEAGTRLELEGIISNYDAAARRFQVAGTQVEFTGNTQFEGGTAANLANNAKVEVKGTRNSAGVFVADKIEIKPTSSIEIGADVQAVDANAGTLVVLGITVHVDPLTTRLEDKSSGADNSPNTPFSLASLRVGDRVEIRASHNAGGAILATRLERDDPDSSVTLQGGVDSVAQPNLTILGVTVTTSGATEFRNIDGTTMTQGDFLSQAQGKLVKAEGTLSGGTIVATQVEFEND